MTDKPTQPADDLEPRIRTALLEFLRSGDNEITLWQMFVALTTEGFTERQALAVIGQVLSANRPNT